MVIATDVVYHGSNYNKLAQLLRSLKDRHVGCEIKVILPGDRAKGQDFLDIMNEQQFGYETQVLSDAIYKA